MWRALSGAGAARWPRARCVRYRRRSVPVLGGCHRVCQGMGGRRHTRNRASYRSFRQGAGADAAQSCKRVFQGQPLGLGNSDLPVARCRGDPAPWRAALPLASRSDGRRLRMEPTCARFARWVQALLAPQQSPVGSPESAVNGDCAACGARARTRRVAIATCEYSWSTIEGAAVGGKGQGWGGLSASCRSAVTAACKSGRFSCTTRQTSSLLRPAYPCTNTLRNPINCR